MKGNLFLGHGRGAVGDVVFSRVNGQQVARARNRNPRDAKTFSQEGIRATFSAAAKFFSLFPAGFFRFAFERKRKGESDYNAFMRANANKGGMITQVQMTDATWFPYGEFAISSGSLSVISVYNDGDQARFIVNGQGSALGPIVTVGELSDWLVGTGDWKNGDIFTILMVYNGWSDRAIDEAEFLQPCPDWGMQILQFEVNTMSELPLSDYGFDEVIAYKSFARLNISPSIPHFGYGAGYAAIHSRRNGGRVLVSDSQLWYAPAYWSKTLDVMQQPSYEAEVLRERGAVPGSILQGNLNQN